MKMSYVSYFKLQLSLFDDIMKFDELFVVNFILSQKIEQQREAIKKVISL